ncbi:YraN family protein [Gilvimarinus sp. DA14]|uniref:YraN family protein n=1 Tax=Gilvimarinus sp. DA14 TaxID=2956798 RepID=UPI0020B79BBF|nr:YraN family protein [Gilvimarinus sp. DA14]UTF59636.1 YraN family protein [Gilvimarinus sp. DA14]
MALFGKRSRGEKRGDQAEQQARAFLQQQGLVFIAANVKGPGGEIDLIMRERQTLVFVEVRLRSNQHFSSAAESVNASKQNKLLRTAAWYLQQQKLTDEIPCRFDVVALSTLDESQPPQWITDAFGTA